VAFRRRAANSPQFTYSFLKGGLLCAECTKHEADKVGAGLPSLRGNRPPTGRITGSDCVVSRGAITFINSLARTRSAALRRAKAPYPLAAETISFLGHVIAAAFEHDPRTLWAMLARMTAPRVLPARSPAKRRCKPHAPFRMGDRP
jgi:hypothetical protein